MDVAEDNKAFETGVLEKASGPSSELSSEVGINASGHKQELERNFSLLSICGVAITTGVSWTSVGGSVVVAIYNGGPPGVIFEFIAVSVFYWLIAASLAELASSMPSSSGVYHWATITAGKHGRPCGFFAGWWNFLAWIFGASSITSILGNQVVAMYAAFHPDFQAHAWHVFVAYLLCGWICCATVLFANRALPKIEILGGFLIIAGVFITIIVCAVMPSKTGTGHASNSFVWHDWSNQTGYTSNGFVFVAGMLNGAYAVGTPDAVTHLAEEIPHPSKNVPKAIVAQMIVGFWTGFLYLIAIFYAVNDLTAVLTSSSTFPIAEIYRQATGSASGSVGLLVLAFLPTFGTAMGCYITASRTFWTLSRDNATPAATFFSRVHPTFKNPFNAIALCGVICTVMGCIYVGSTTAFNAFVGSYVILSTLSYLAAILPHLLSRRANIAPGWFWMKGPVGYIVNATSVLYIMAFIVIFCFPFALPVTAKSMNYACLITGGLTVFVAGFWVVRRKSYVGPRVVTVGVGELARDAI